MRKTGTRQYTFQPYQFEAVQGTVQSNFVPVNTRDGSHLDNDEIYKRLSDTPFLLDTGIPVIQHRGQYLRPLVVSDTVVEKGAVTQNRDVNSDYIVSYAVDVPGKTTRKPYSTTPGHGDTLQTTFVKFNESTLKNEDISDSINKRTPVRFLSSKNGFNEKRQGELTRRSDIDENVLFQRQIDDNAVRRQRLPSISQSGFGFLSHPFGRIGGGIPNSTSFGARSRLYGLDFDKYTADDALLMRTLFNDRSDSSNGNRTIPTRNVETLRAPLSKSTKTDINGVNKAWMPNNTHATTKPLLGTIHDIAMHSNRKSEMPFISGFDTILSKKPLKPVFDGFQIGENTTVSGPLIL